MTINDFFLHNWRATASLETNYATDVVQSHDTLAEERRGLLNAPHRVLTLQWTGVNQDETNRLLMEIMRAGTQQMLVPFSMDQSVSTAPSSVNTINCDTTNRHFVVGGQVLIFQIGGNGRPTNPQTFVISAIGGGTLTTSTPITGTYPTGSLVFPLMLAEIALTNKLRLQTDQVSELTLSFLEVAATALPASALTGAPGNFATQTSSANPNGAANTPILDVPPDFLSEVSVTSMRLGSRYPIGRSSMVDVLGTRPLLQHSFKLLLGSRVDTWSMLQFFESRRGRLIPFWLVNPATLFAPIGQAAGYIDVTPSGDIGNAQAFIEYLAIVMNDGTIYVRKVSSIAVNGGNWRITAASLPGLTFANIYKVTSAHFVRFNKDALQIDYMTDEVSQVSIDTVECLSEAVTDTTATSVVACARNLVCAAGTWFICLVAYMWTPRDFGGDCPVCLIGARTYTITINPGDPCIITVPINLSDGYYSPTGVWNAFAGGCAGFTGNVPIVLQDSRGTFMEVYGYGPVLGVEPFGEAENPPTQRINVFAHMSQVIGGCSGHPARFWTIPDYRQIWGIAAGYGTSCVDALYPEG